MKQLRVLSLFSGCGGLDLGFEGGFTCLKKSVNPKIHPSWITKDLGNFVKLKKTRFAVVFENDLKLSAKVTWTNYFQKPVDYHTDSIVDLVKKFYKKEFHFPDNIDLVIGGFPCQDFSIAGKRQGFNSAKTHLGEQNQLSDFRENRGNLYFWMKEVIKITKPKLFVAENVGGLATMPDHLQKIVNDFSEADYLIVPYKILFAQDYGVPQSRSRIFFIGFQKSALTPLALDNLMKSKIPEIYDPFPVKTHSAQADDYHLSFVTCQDAFQDLSEPNESSDPAQQSFSKAKFLPHRQGNKEVTLNKISMTIRSEHHGNIEFRRLFKANGGTHIAELDQKLSERRLTVRECARLQTFPDDYQFILPATKINKAVSASEAYKLIGNAVPCLLAYHLATNLENKWSLYFGGDDEK